MDEPLTLHENSDHLDELFRADRFAASIGVELDTWSGGVATATELPPVGRSRWLRGRGGLGWIVVLLPSNGSGVAEGGVSSA
ncbi:MAG: hypothetical protein ACI8Y4_003949 [Candidatus Poriferisodalaceae bacterium]|jgi:hypothetical protein